MLGRTLPDSLPLLFAECAGTDPDPVVRVTIKKIERTEPIRSAPASMTRAPLEQSLPEAPLDYRSDWVGDTLEERMAQRQQLSSGTVDPVKVAPTKIEPPKVAKLPEVAKGPSLGQRAVELADDFAKQAPEILSLRTAGKIAGAAGVLAQATQNSPAVDGTRVIDFFDPHAGAGELDYFVAAGLEAMGFDVEVPPKPWRRAREE